jgi:hypothetical protein
MFGCAGIAAVAAGCVADSADADVDQTQLVEAELAASPDGTTADTIGQYHQIRLSNTNLCLQPLNGTPSDAVVELRTCNGSRAQHWLFSSKSFNEWEVLNLQSANCLYNDTDVLFNGAGPIVQGGCDIFGTNSPASNALWHPSVLRGNASLQSRVGHHDTGFCVDVPGVPFDGIQMRNFRCNGTPAQIFVVGSE